MNIIDSICTQVSEFNFLFGVINYDYDPSNTNTFEFLFNNLDNKFNEKQVRLRFGLINEESNELIDAFTQNDPIEIIDGLCDILYVVAGAKVYFNLSNKLITSILSYDNLDKSILSKPKLDLESIKNIETLLKSHTYLFENIIEKLKLSNSLLDEITNKIILSTEVFDIIKIKEYNEILDNIIQIVFKISDMLELNIFDLFDLVHKSNMSKVCEDPQTAIKTVEWYQLNENRYSKPSYKEIEYKNKKYWVIFDDETNKILKSINYNPVKFI